MNWQVMVCLRVKLIKSGQTTTIKTKVGNNHNSQGITNGVNQVTMADGDQTKVITIKADGEMRQISTIMVGIQATMDCHRETTTQEDGVMETATDKAGATISLETMVGDFLMLYMSTIYETYLIYV
jgi:hypothetical protein